MDPSIFGDPRVITAVPSEETAISCAPPSFRDALHSTADRAHIGIPRKLLLYRAGLFEQAADARDFASLELIVADVATAVQSHLVAADLWPVWQSIAQKCALPDEHGNASPLWIPLLTEAIKGAKPFADHIFALLNRLASETHLESYEDVLANASLARASSQKAWTERELVESDLAAQGFSSEAYLKYIRWELAVPHPDPFCVRSICERAVEAHPHSISLWYEYMYYALKNLPDIRLLIARRAVQATNAGPIWALWALASEADNVDLAPFITTYVLRTKTSFSSSSDASDFYTTVADTARRRGDMDSAIAVLRKGKHAVDTLGRDPSYRLVAYLAQLLDAQGAQDSVIALWKQATYESPDSLDAAQARIASLVSYNRLDEARKALRQIISRGSLSVSSAMVHQLDLLERVHGTLDTHLAARAFIDVWHRRHVSQRPLKSESSDQVDPNTVLDSAAPHGPVEANTVTPTTKRPQPTQTPDHDTEHAPKRSRESLVVTVEDLPSDTTEDDLRLLFADCGGVREVRLSLPLAQVEFSTRENLLAGLTKTLKPIRGHQVTVREAHGSTLFVTNFPDSYVNDERMRALFAKYGPLADLRWPSRQKNASRRFVYVQFLRASDARRAQEELNGTQLDGVALVVLVSDPASRKDRSVPGEIYIAGLPQSVTDADLRDAFSSFGTINGVRIPQAHGHARGFAYIQFAEKTAATAALALDKQCLVQLGDRPVSVSYARAAPQRAAEDPENKVHVSRIPRGTQADLVQQAFETSGLPVRHLEYTEGNEHADVQLARASDVGRILMGQVPVRVGGAEVRVAPHVHLRPTERPRPRPAFVPRSARKRV